MPETNEQHDLTFVIGNMDCANCALEVEEGVRRLPGIEQVSVDFASGRMTLRGEVPFPTLQNRVEALGKTINPYDPDHTAPLAPPEGNPLLGFLAYMAGRPDTRLALAGGTLILLTLLGRLLGLPAAAAPFLYTAGMLITLYPILKSGLNALRINRQFNINLLMSIAAFGAILIGEFLESATVIFFFAIGEALEGYAANRARRSIGSLLALKPKRALLLAAAGEEREVPVEALLIGQHILVKPGENIPMDGRVVAGQSGVDQAPITGESVPVAKTAGDEVFAGSINGAGALTVEVTRLAADNTLNRIIRLVEEAQSNRAPSQRLVDRFAAWYTPAVVALAVLVAAVPPLFFGAPFLDTPDGHGWLYRALAMLVIACPCALVISTPVTVISAINAAARGGVLIKGGAFLEQLGQIRVFAFDKTGTLTSGRPVVTSFQALDCLDTPECPRCDDLLAVASAVERRTTHPLAQAVVDAAAARALDRIYAPALDVEQLAGEGVRGRLGGKEILIGSHAYFDRQIPHPEPFCRQIDDLEAQGQTAVILAEDGQTRGYIALADTPRTTTAAVIADLNRLGLTTVMLTGDHERVAQEVGRQVGVTEIRAGLLPQDKVAAVEALRRERGEVAMVGDGINDTPALAAASVGIAMGGAGSPQALETADIALMADDLTRLPFAVRLSRFARRLIRQNVALSFGIKALFLLLAFFGLTSLWLAILADVGMALVVTLNGMRPLRFTADS